LAVLSMSKQEFSRLEVLLRVQSGRLRVADACVLIGLQRRQVFRLLRGLKQDGAASLLSKHRGKPSNHRLPAEVRTLALSIVRERYADFGPTMAVEKLSEHHGCSVSRETLRGWMIADGLWQDRRHRLPAPHQPRRRRDCLGELVQIDGSEHAWFEDRGPPCTLLAFVDDATSRLMQLRFVTSESAFDYFRTTRAYLEEHGKPVALYSDKHGIFRVNSKDAAGGDGVTQFGRALLALNIDIICANSPQAKGRIERAFGTLQDRMVKELRLAGISSIAAANAWLAGFIAVYNTRFGRDPANPKNLHRPLAQAEDLDEILAWREERTVTRNLTLHYDRMMLILDPTPLTRGLVRQKVEVVNYPDGRFAVQFNGATLGFKVFDKIQTVQPGAIVDNKRLSTVLEQIKAQQAAYPARQQRGHGARQRPPNNLEAPGLPSKGRAPRHGAIAAPADRPQAGHHCAVARVGF
jgi:Winged helix-turn helix